MQHSSSGKILTRVFNPVARKRFSRSSSAPAFVTSRSGPSVKIGDFTPSLVENPVQRLEQLNRWLKTVSSGQDFELSPASADASFRRYYRITRASDQPSLIVMDAPPAHEDCGPWLKVASLFRDAGVNVPQVFAHDPGQGFILMSDLGSTTYLDALTPDNAANLYADALGSLIVIQQSSAPGVLPEYSHELLLREVRLFDEWYVARHLGVALDATDLSALSATYERILATNLTEPRVFVHRDYHSRNLMHQPGADNPGIIDFQDAVYGPLSYDLVSLFKDAYIHWEEDFVLDLLARYWQTARQVGLPVRSDFADFHRDFDWMGVQRHLKVLGIFARLYHRDGKEGYLKDLPLVFDYLHKTCQRYRDLTPLLRLLDRLQPQAVTIGYTF
jgi:aminoglycoside/choline kinase family phosphotransferase